MFEYKNNEMYCEDIPVASLAKKYGTPLFVYSANKFKDSYKQLEEAFKEVDNIICFAVKSNGNLAVLKTFAELGSGFDIVTAGELYRIIKAGGDPGRAVFAGVGKTHAEIRFAIENEILFFSVESEVELSRINEIAAEVGKIARFSIRVNPDVDPKTHKYITTGKGENKFGLDFEMAKKMYLESLSLENVQAVGVQMHIGSQITTTAPYTEAARKLAGLVEELRALGITIDYVDVGGGFGIVYDDECPPTPAEFAAAILPELKKLKATLIIEPGRFLSGNAGVMLTTVEYVKKAPTKKFVIVDAGMNDLIRPALYQAYHGIATAKVRPGALETVDVVGPICESSDCFGNDRELAPIEAGDLLVVKSTGAYGYVMASHYNTRPKAAEVMVDGNQAKLVRKRECWDDLLKNEIDI